MVLFNYCGFCFGTGRDVFVVPGNINSSTSVGTNRLIKEGAKLVNCYEDIIEETKEEGYKKN